MRRQPRRPTPSELSSRGGPGAPGFLDLQFLWREYTGRRLVADEQTKRRLREYDVAVLRYAMYRVSQQSSIPTTDDLELVLSNLCQGHEDWQQRRLRDAVCNEGARSRMRSGAPSAWRLGRSPGYRG